MFWDLSQDIYKCLACFRGNATGRQQFELMYDIASLYEAPVNCENLMAVYAVERNNGTILPYIKKGVQLQTKDVADIASRMLPNKKAGSCTDLFRPFSSGGDVSVCSQCPLSCSYMNAKRDDEIYVMNYILSHGGPAAVNLNEIHIDNLIGSIHSIEYVPANGPKHGHVFGLLEFVADAAVADPVICGDFDTFISAERSRLSVELRRIPSLRGPESLNYCVNFISGLWVEKEFDQDRLEKAVRNITADYSYTPPVFPVQIETPAPDTVAVDISTDDVQSNPSAGTDEGQPPECPTLDKVSEMGLPDLMNFFLSDGNTPSPSTVIHDTANAPSCTKDTGDCAVADAAPASSEKNEAGEPCIDGETTDENSELPAQTQDAASEADDDCLLMGDGSNHSICAEEAADERQGKTSWQKEDRLSVISPFVPVDDSALLDIKFVPSPCESMGYVPGCVPDIEQVSSVVCPVLRTDAGFLSFEKELCGNTGTVACESVVYNGTYGLLMSFGGPQTYFLRYDSDCYGMLHTVFNSENIAVVTSNMYQLARYVFQYDCCFNSVFELRALYDCQGSSFTAEAEKRGVSCSDWTAPLQLIPQYIEMFRPLYAHIGTDEAYRQSVMLRSSNSVIHAFSADISGYIVCSVDEGNDGFTYGNVESVRKRGMEVGISDISVAANIYPDVRMSVFHKLIVSGACRKYNIKLFYVDENGFSFYIPSSPDMYDALDLLLRMVSKSIRSATHDVPQFKCTPKIVY